MNLRNLKWIVLQIRIIFKIQKNQSNDPVFKIMPIKPYVHCWSYSSITPAQIPENIDWDIYFRTAFSALTPILSPVICAFGPHYSVHHDICVPGKCMCRDQSQHGNATASTRMTQCRSVPLGPAVGVRRIILSSKIDSFVWMHIVLQ